MKLTKAQQQLADRLKTKPMLFGSGGFSLKTWKALSRLGLLGRWYYPYHDYLKEIYKDPSIRNNYSVYAYIEDDRLLNPNEIVERNFIYLHQAIIYAKDLQNKIIDSKKRLNYWHQNIIYSVACEINYENSRVSKTAE